MATFFPLIPDEPCIDTELLPERQRLIEQIGHAVAYSGAPLVVGVHGDWGAGKTSFLHALQYHLTGRCPQNPSARQAKPGHPHVAAVWFEAWRHQHEASPLVALLHEIRAQLTFTGNPSRHLVDQFKKYGPIAIDGALRAFDQAAGAVAASIAQLPVDPTRIKLGVVEGVRGAGEAWEAEHYAVKLPSTKLRELLCKAVANLLPTSSRKPKSGPTIHPRLVVFIDDLDRCEPETTLRLLDGLKVYLNLPNCVFVLGLNQRETERALARVMPSGGSETAEITIRAHEYLEKICANVWHLPRVPVARQAELLAAWLAGKLDPAFLAAILKLLTDHEFLPANARRLKTFANALLRYYHARVDGGDTPRVADAPLFCVIACLQQFHPKLWRLVEGEPAFLLELQAYARGSLEKKAAPAGTLRTARDLHPALAELELPGDASVDLEKVRSDTMIYSSRFADRAYGNVLHCQRLLAELGVDRTRITAFLAL